jgi:hypothetical protein
VQFLAAYEDHKQVFFAENFATITVRTVLNWTPHTRPISYFDEFTVDRLVMNSGGPKTTEI